MDVFIVVVEPLTVRSPSIVTFPLAFIVDACIVLALTVPVVVKLLLPSDTPDTFPVVISLLLINISPKVEVPPTLSAVVRLSDVADTSPFSP